MTNQFVEFLKRKTITNAATHYVTMLDKKQYLNIQNKKIINLQNFFSYIHIKIQKSIKSNFFQSKCTNFGYFIHIKRQNFSIFLEIALNPLTMD